MKAVVLRGPRNLEYAEVPMPRMTAKEHILVRVEACGVCGSDLRYWAGENPWAMHTIGHHVDNPPNIIMGHEYAGVVTAVNSATYEHLLGKRVGVQSYRVCGECALCRAGRHNLCKRTVHMGHGQGWGKMDYYPGAYAEYCLGWGDLVYPMPDGASFTAAAMADILCVAVHACGRVRSLEGADVLLIGGGPVGLSIAQVARARGARNVFVKEVSPAARKMVSQCGFTVIDPTEERFREPVDAVFDTVGSEATIGDGLGLLRESGTYVSLAVHSSQLRLNPAALASERSITTSSNAFYADVSEAYRLIFAGEVDAAGLISHRLPLAEYGNAFEMLLAEPKRAYKVVFAREG